jgi:hypothetical protein
MITRTIYVPANAFGRQLLEQIWERVSCSMGDIHKVDNMLRVAITMPERELVKVENILQKFDLI